MKNIPFSHIKNSVDLYDDLFALENRHRSCICIPYSNFEEGFIDETSVITMKYSFNRDAIDIFSTESSCLTLKGRWFMHLMEEYLDNKWY